MTIKLARSRARGLLVLLSSVSLLFVSSSFGHGLFPASASSQSAAQKARQDYALIYGTVWGPDDRHVGGIPIKIRRASDKKPKWELISDQSGEFAQRVPVGTQDYIVQADVKVPKGASKPEVKVHIEDNERKDVGVHLNQQQLPRK